MRHPVHVVSGFLVARGADPGKLEDDLFMFALERLALEQLHVMRQSFHPLLAPFLGWPLGSGVAALRRPKLLRQFCPMD